MIIVAAAIRWQGEVYSVPSPGRHNHVFALMLTKHPNQVGPFLNDEQGFVTSCGSFVSRKQAAHMALSTGQIKKLKWPPNLYSEDLW